MKGSRNRWALIGTHPDMDGDDKIKPFEILDLVIGLIVSTPQAPVYRSYDRMTEMWKRMRKRKIRWIRDLVETKIWFRLIKCYRIKH